MLMLLKHPNIPDKLHGKILVDRNGIPRYWAAIYSTFFLSHLAQSTLDRKLRFIDQLYEFSEITFHGSRLEEAISNIDVNVLGNICESYFISILNNEHNSEIAESKWQVAFDFVKDTTLLISKGNIPTDRLNALVIRFEELSRLYAQLKIGKKRIPETIRSLPASVVSALDEILDPESANNPFKNMNTRWCYYVSFLLLLNQGIRRSELLLLPVDAIKSAFDARHSKIKFWINIEEKNYGVETRHSRPFIKNNQSIRQIPITEMTARIVQIYIDGYRRKCNHPFLLNSLHGKPLSAESLNKTFQKLTEFLPKDVMQELYDRTGKTVITPHDLRHTCAVIRLNQLLGQGDSMDEALEKIRAFFGWSRDSTMPLKYAKAVFEDRLANTWNDIFDDRVLKLRYL
jgi:integrase